MTDFDPTRPLAGIRIIECSMLGPAGVTGPFADMGADVIKIEPPNGDYARNMTWPIVEGTSLLFLHSNRGKSSVILDLRKPEGVEVFLDLVRGADAVVEAMRPGGLERRGLGFDKLLEVNPKIVFLTISGYGLTGPYRDYPSHGIAYDTWAGVINPAVDEDGFTYIPEHVSVGINAGPLRRVRDPGRHHPGTGDRARLPARSGAVRRGGVHRLAALGDLPRVRASAIRSHRKRLRRRPPRAPGTAGMKEGVRYNIYESSDGYVLFMASERAFWKNFAEGVGRAELFEKWPGEQYADHATGNVELHHELKAIFKTKTTQEWLDFGGEFNTPIAPVNSPQTLINDPQFKDRLPWIPKEQLGADMLPFPVKVVGGELAWPTKAPTLGQHTDEILRSRLGYDDAKIAELRKGGALGEEGAG